MTQPQQLTIRLNRNDSSSPWGFRLQGGKDFGTPLLIQKVNMGSIAERAGLQVGDAVIRVNGQELQEQRHKDAQDAIVRGGNNVEISIQRGGHNTWKPSVTPIGTTPSPNPYTSCSPSPVTKTSLAATNKRPSPTIGSGYNSVSKPYSPQMNGGYVNDSGSIKAIVNKQYNTPVGIYSDESIAETLSAQAEVLAGGVLGVNFKKNEKNYDAEHSEVFKMVQEVDKEPKSPEPDVLNNNHDSGVIPTPPPVSGLRHVSAPQSKPPGSNSSLSPGQNICADCERLIVGVFVRIKDMNLHVECFKCATCGTSLKNVGYYSINNKLYCDIHAKMIARQNPPAPNLEPVTIPPSSSPFGQSKSFSAPKASSLSPVSFQTSRQTPGHVSSPLIQPQFNSNNIGKSPPPMSNNFSCNFSSPKPADNFSKNQLPSSSNNSFQSYYDPNRQPLLFLKPRNDKISAFMPIMKSEIRQTQTETKKEHLSNYKSGSSFESCTTGGGKIKEIKLETVFESFDNKSDEKEDGSGIESSNYPDDKRPSVCSQEVSKVLSESMQKTSLSSSLNKQMLMTFIKESDQRPQSPVPSEDGCDFTSAESNKNNNQNFIWDDSCRSEASYEVECISSRPHGIRPLSPAVFDRPITPNQIVVFPPEIPSIIHVKPRSRTVTPQPVRGNTGASSNNNFRSSGDEKDRPKFIGRSEWQQIGQETSREQKFNPIVGSSCNLLGQDSTEFSKSKNDFDPLKKNSTELNSISSNQQLLSESFEQIPISISSEFRSYSPITVQCMKTQELAKIQLVEGSDTKTKSELGSLINFDDSPINKNQSEDLCCIIERTRETIRITSPVPMIFKSDLPQLQSVHKSDVRITELSSGDDKNENPSLKSLPQIKQKPGLIASGITIAPDRPFTPVEPIKPLYLQESVPLPKETQPYIPSSDHVPEIISEKKTNKKRENRPLSPFVEALTTATNRPYSPLPSMHKPFPEEGTKEPPVEKRLTMANALATAPKRSYHLSESKIPPAVITTNAEDRFSSNVVNKISESKLPPLDDPSITLKDTTLVDKDFRPKSTTIDTKSSSVNSQTAYSACSYMNQYYQACIPSISSELKALFEDKSRLGFKLKSSSDSIESSECRRQGVIEKHSQERFMETFEKSSESRKVSQEIVEKRTQTPNRQPYTPTGLHKANTLPYYQKCVEELTAKNKTPTPSRFSTPTPSSRKSTPIKQIDQQQRKIQQRPVSCQEFQSCSLKSTAKCFLTESSNITEKITPTLGYQPCPLIQGGSFCSSQQQQTNNKNPFATIGIENKLNPTVPFFSGNESIKESSSRICKLEESINILERKNLEIESTEIKSCYVTAITSLTSTPNDHHTIKSSLASSIIIAPTEHTLKSSVAPSNAPNKSSASSLTSSTFSTSTSDHNIMSAKLSTSTYSSTACSSQSQPIPVTPTGSPSQCFKPPPDLSPLTAKNMSQVAAQLTQNLIKLSTSPHSFLHNKIRPACSNTSKKPACMLSLKPNSSSDPNKPTGGADGVGFRNGTAAGFSAPRRGRGVLNQQNLSPGARIPLCAQCNSQIRGPFVTAIGKIWCPDHFICVNQKCRRSLMDIGFVEEPSGLYCEYCFEQYLAPTCSKCSKKVKGDCLNAIGKHFHPECFNCAYCGKLFGNSPFFLEDGLPYCENDWNELFTTKCIACGFPIEAGDRWVEALNNNYHSPCFNCTTCKTNLEGQSFYAKGGRPFCKNHAR